MEFNPKLSLRVAITCLALLPMSGLVCAAELLGTAVIRDSSVYRAPELFDAYKAHLGQPVSKQTAASIAESVRQKYLDDGYSRPGYRIEDPGLSSGIVRIRIIEPNISAVRRSGNAGPYDARLDTLFASLSSPQALRPGEIRDALRRARQLPGLDVKVSTAPDEERHGAFVLQVESEYQRLQGNVSLSNRGTEQIGRNLAFARIVANSPFDTEGSLGLFVTSAESSTAYGSGGIYVNAALGEGGTVARLQGSVTSLEVDSGGILVDQNREHFLLKVSHPLVSDQDRKLTVWGLFDVDNLDMLQDGVKSREDRLRSLESGVTMSWRSGTTQQLASLELELGLNGFGSRLQNLIGDGDLRNRNYAIERLQYVRLTRFGEQWTLRFDGYAQHSTHILPSIKRFKLGGGRIGRGFEAAAVSGDRGVAAKVELKRSLARELTLFGNAAFYGFYDIGTAWRNDVSERESAASAGVGTSIRRERVSAYLEVARPLTHADADGRRDAGVFGEISVRF